MRLRSRVALDHGGAIVDAAAAIVRRLERGGLVLCLGNGGSATDATDLAYDFIASCDVPAISLASDPAVLTAIANDVGAEAIFQRQIIALAQPRDVVVAFSTSGGSANVRQALAGARARGLLTVAIVGYHGGEIGRLELADHIIAVHSDQIPRVQEVHGSIAHVLVELIGAIARSA